MDRQFWPVWWSHNGLDSVLTVLLGFSTLASIFIPTYNFRRVMEQDPALSYPFEEETVGMVLLLLLGGVLPWVAVLCSQLLMRFWEIENTFSNDMTKSQLCLLQILAVSTMFTNILKAFLGKPRPNFFAWCDYHGFRSAVQANNFTEYNNQTVFGRQVVSGFVCPSNSGAYQAFPSGHASLAFAGLGFLALFWAGALDLSLPNKAWKIVVACCPLLVASIVAGSRCRDYFHNFEEVLAGAAIGGVTAFALYCAHFRPHSNRPHRHPQAFALVDSIS